MSTQIFKKNIPKEFFFEFLDKISIKNEKYYLLNSELFKKSLYNDILKNFINICLPYYHISKRKYLERNITYKHFLTILRQICNSNGILYTSKIKYDKSNYDMVYYIYF
jgi:hypothetical protein